MDLLKEFKQFIKQQNLFKQTDKLLLAVSGGVDSVVLCELCKQSGYNFTIAHCNFQLRGEESNRDEKFVKELGNKYGVEVLIKKFDTEKFAGENKLSIQVAARQLRYAWFNELLLADPAKLNYILTAHHTNDDIETLLMNFFKGTGINGLRGILPRQEKLIRPLLFAKKEEIAAFASTHKLAFVEDSSNESDKYTRNYFRNKLIPGIKEVFPEVENNLADNISRFREIEMLYEQAMEQHKKKLLVQKEEEIHIPVLRLQKAEPLATIIYEIIKDHGFTAHQVNDVINLLKADSGKYIRSEHSRIIKNRNWLIISPNETTHAQNILIEEDNAKVEFEGGKLKIEKLLRTSDFRLQTSSDIAQLDAGEIKFPLLLRKWKQGDYFYPLGMKKEKVSRFFIDQKLSLTQKEKVWVIEMNKKIAWVIGLRIDDRFKITDKTKEILQIEWRPAE